MLEAVLGTCAILATAGGIIGFIGIIMKKLNCDKEVKIAEIAHARK